MAVGKEAPISDVSVKSAQCRYALEQSVEQFTEAIAKLTPATIRRRLKDSEVEIAIVPNDTLHL